MPSAAIPTVTPGFSFAGGLHLLAGLLGGAAQAGPCLVQGSAASRRTGRPGTAATRLQRDELMAMSSHELSDLGIGRSEIPALFGEPSSWRSSRY
jgi:hypothetical protein